MSKYTREDKIAFACAQADDYADKLFGDDGIARTVQPTQRSTVRETVVLESPASCGACSVAIGAHTHDENCSKASVTNIREWLMRDVMSTPYATIRS